MRALDIHIDSILLGTVLQVSFKQPNTDAILASVKKNKKSDLLPQTT